MHDKNRKYSVFARALRAVEEHFKLIHTTPTPRGQPADILSTFGGLFYILFSRCRTSRFYMNCRQFSFWRETSVMTPDNINGYSSPQKPRCFYWKFSRDVSEKRSSCDIWRVGRDSGECVGDLREGEIAGVGMYVRCFVGVKLKSS